MNKLSIKHKFKIGEEVILKNYPNPGWCTVTNVEKIIVDVQEKSYDVYYILRHGYGDRKYTDVAIESIEEFNKRQRLTRKNYKSYVNWLNTHNFIEDKSV